MDLLLDELTLEKIKDFQTYEEFQTFIEEIENDIACFNSGIYKYNSYLKTLEYRYWLITHHLLLLILSTLENIFEQKQ